MDITYPTSQQAAVRLSPIRLLLVGGVVAGALVTATLGVPALTGGGAAGAALDRSYDQIENTRVVFGSSTTRDASYDQAEKARLHIGLSNVTTDPSYDNVERLRAGFGD